MTRSSIRNFGIAFFVLLLSLVALLLMLSQINQKASLLKEQLISIEVQNKRETTFYTLQRKSEDSTTQRAVIENYFLGQTSDSIDFLNQVEKLAPMNGVTLETDALEEAGDKKTKQKWIEATFTFSGSQKNVEEFIEILESLPYLSQVTSVSMSSQASHVWEANVSMRVFILNYEI